MINRTISILFLIFIGLTSAVFFVVALLIWLLTVAFDRRLVMLHLFSSFWASLYLWLMPAWSVHVEGRRKPAWRRHFVIVFSFLLNGCPKPRCSISRSLGGTCG